MRSRPNTSASDTPDTSHTHTELPKRPVWQPIRGPFERWPHLTDLLLAILALLLTLLMWSRTGDVLALQSLWDVAAFQCGFIGCFALLWRRTHPWQVHAVVLAAMLILELGLPADGIVALAFSLYALGRYEANTRTSFIGVIAAIVFVAIDQNTLVQPTAGGTVTVMLVWALWYIGRRLRFRGEYLRLLEERADYLERERNAEAERAVAAERTRIAREMHDVVAHQVSLMTVQAGAARAISRNNPEAASEALAAVEAAGRQAMAEMRDLLGVLRPADAATLTPQPGLDDLTALIEKVRLVVPKVEYEKQGDLESVPTSVSLAAYRIVQESLTNVVKHVGSKASVYVSIKEENYCLSIRVCDAGHSAAEPSGDTKFGGGPSAGHGIAGMRERAELLGGHLHTGVLAQGGFEVAAQLPTATGRR
ncbi:sensor histidine kinase [Microbulbifer agarilyticus]